MRQLRPLRWVITGIVGALAAISAFLLAYFFLNLTALKAAQVAGVLGLFVTLAKELLPKIWSMGKWSRQSVSGPVTSGELDDLALELRRQFDSEWQARRLQDPVPMPVKWGPVDSFIQDHWENIHGVSRAYIPLDMSGQINGPSGSQSIVDLFYKIPSRRLVILGEGGAGKSVLALNFSRLMADPRRRSSGQPVPVIFSIGSWDPKRPLRDWMSSYLSTIIPGLGVRISDGRTRARELLDRGSILPVLDGLDEMPKNLHVEAILALNHMRKDGQDPLLLTCRKGHYLDALNTANTLLTAAAVVELKPLTLVDLQDYLPLTARPSKEGGQGVTTKWQPLLDTLDDRSAQGGNQRKNVLRVLSNPLMAGLARVTYSDTSANPMDLLKSRFSSRTKIENHLLDQLVPSVYSSVRVHVSKDESVQRWSAKQVYRWLVFLAVFLDFRKEQDFRWWELSDSLTRNQLAVTVGSVSGFAAGFGIMLPSFWVTNFPGSIVFFLLNGIAVGLTLGFVTRLMPVDNSVIRPQLIDFASRFARSVLGVVFGLIAGFVAWKAAHLLGKSTVPLPASLVTGLATGMMIGFSAEFGYRSEVVPAAIRVKVQLKDYLKKVAARSLAGLKLGFPLGLLLVVMMLIVDSGMRQTATSSPFSYANSVLAFELLAGLTMGTLFGLFAILTSWLEIESDVTSVADPVSLIRAARASALLSGLPLAIPAGILVGVLSIGGKYGIDAVVFISYNITLIVFLGIIVNTAWGRFVLTCINLRLRGKLPLRLMLFLRDARSRGVLRQSGASYQFRHARLHDRFLRG